MKKVCPTCGQEMEIKDVEYPNEPKKQWVCLCGFRCATFDRTEEA